MEIEKYIYAVLQYWLWYFSVIVHLGADYFVWLEFSVIILVYVWLIIRRCVFRKGLGGGRVIVSVSTFLKNSKYDINDTFFFIRKYKYLGKKILITTPLIKRLLLFVSLIYGTLMVFLKKKTKFSILEKSIVFE